MTHDQRIASLLALTEGLELDEVARLLRMGRYFDKYYPRIASSFLVGSTDPVLPGEET